MSLYIIIGILALAAMAFLSFKVFKGVLRAVFSIISSLFLIFIILGGIIYMDVQKANTLLEEGDKVILYNHNNTCVVGVQITGTDIQFTGDGGFPEEVKTLDAEKCLHTLNLAEDKKIEDSFVFVLNEEVLTPVTKVDVFGYSIEKEVAEEILLSENAKEAVIDIAIAQELERRIEEFPNIEINEEVLEGLIEEYRNEINTEFSSIEDTEIRASIFLLLTNQILEQEGEEYLLEHMKEKNIDIYPQFLIIKGIQLLPDKVFDKVLAKLENMTSEAKTGKNNQVAEI